MWDKSLTMLGIQEHWPISVMKLKMIKNLFPKGHINMTMPVLVLGIQRIDYEAENKRDVNCILQDRSGNLN